MKKDRRKTVRRTGAAIAAAVLSLPASGMMQEASAQDPGRRLIAPIDSGSCNDHKLIKVESTLTIVGLNAGQIVYKNTRGDFFTVDPRTGDMNFIKPGTFKTIRLHRTNEHKDLKLHKDSKFHKDAKFHKGSDASGGLTIVGTDDFGNVLHKNAGGEVFYLNTKTGDMVFVP